MSMSSLEGDDDDDNETDDETTAPVVQPPVDTSHQTAAESRTFLSEYTQWRQKNKNNNIDIYTGLLSLSRKSTDGPN